MAHNIILRDIPETHANLLPLTFTRPISHIQTGILTLGERWQALLEGSYSYSTTDYLSPKFPLCDERQPDSIVIASDVTATSDLVSAIMSLRHNQQLTDKSGKAIAWRGEASGCNAATSIIYEGHTERVQWLYDIFAQCGENIERDFPLVTRDRTGAPLPASCTLIGPAERLFIEEDANVEGAIINVKNGSVYIGHRAEVMEGSCLRGPVAVLSDAHVNMCTRIYGPTVIGHWCKVGGELNNVVMHPYSNKAHDGFLGNAVIGSWCNLGAGCTASNLKNDYSEIKLWNYPARRFLKTGLQFCGLIMGDHSKAGINTMFNTATVVGVGCNIHGTGFPRNFVASFSEGSPTAGFTDVSLSAFRRIAERVMARRNVRFTETDMHLFEAIRSMAETYK